MIASEFDQFALLLAKAEKLYGKDLDDATVQLYWEALKDLPLPTVERKLGECIKRGKFFPKPSEMRPREDAGFEVSDKGRRDFEAMEKANIEFWDERMRENPIATKWELLGCYNARTTLFPKGSLEYIRRTELAEHARRNLSLESEGYA